MAERKIADAELRFIFDVKETIGATVEKIIHENPFLDILDPPKEVEPPLYTPPETKKVFRSTQFTEQQNLAKKYSAMIQEDLLTRKIRSICTSQD